MTERSSLRPDETIQKSFISTTSLLYGEYEADDLLITHAWSFDRPVDRRFTEGAASRNVFVVSFRTEAYEKKPGVVVPDYSHSSQAVAATLSVLFGKRFDDHGMYENSGMHQAPDFSQVNTLCAHWLPQNSHKERADLGIPLNLTAVERIAPVFFGGDLDERFARTFRAASSFYSQALQTAEQVPDVAYIHLITAGEVIANFQEQTNDNLLDDEAKGLLEQVSSLGPAGPELARRLSKRFWTVKRKFVAALLALTDDSFFETSEAKQEYERFKVDKFEKRLAAAYDLRSRYVHAGTNFGRHVARNFAGGNAEIQHGHPVTGDRDLDKMLALAPTLIGLERVIRSCLLRLAIANGGLLAPRNSEKPSDGPS